MANYTRKEHKSKRVIVTAVVTRIDEGEETAVLYTSFYVADPSAAQRPSMVLDKVENAVAKFEATYSHLYDELVDTQVVVSDELVITYQARNSQCRVVAHEAWSHTRHATWKEFEYPESVDLAMRNDIEYLM